MFAFKGLEKKVIDWHRPQGSPCESWQKGQWPKAMNTGTCHRTSVKEKESKGLKVKGSCSH